MKFIFYVEFYLTPNCNQKCKYCNVYKYSNQNVEIDIDKFEYIVKLIKEFIPHNDIFIELSGGEPGLIKNLFDLIYILKKYDIKYYQVMSNGLVRKNFDWWIEIPYYKEHLIYEIDDKEIIKFYDINLQYANNVKNIIVMTEKTTKSLLKNFKYFKEQNIINTEYFWFKKLVPKVSNISQYETYLKLFYKLINYPSYYTENQNKNYKKCSLNTPHLYIDFEEELIGHCSFYKSINKYSKHLNKENIIKMINKKLFNIPNYCSKCYLASQLDNLNDYNKFYNKNLEIYE